MPILCEILQLVIPKHILEFKYKGGLAQFKEDYKWDSIRDHEDNELISIVSNSNDFAVPAGLDYNANTGTSKDFIVVARYATPAISWPVDWCETNKVYIWHTDCRLSAYREAIRRSNMDVAEIENMAKETGEFPLSDIY